MKITLAASPEILKSPTSDAQPFDTSSSTPSEKTELQPGENICSECSRLIV